jgi:hypothetical protein
MELNPEILDLTAPVVFFPVRHHSPACARLVRELAHRIKPATILIEGPSDFNSQIAELNLPHELPIAIYSFANLAEGNRRGAFYPYCIYSPECPALVSTIKSGAIALPNPTHSAPSGQCLSIDACWLKLQSICDSANNKLALPISLP